MRMKTREISLSCLALTVVAIAGIGLWRGSTGQKASDDFPEGTSWLCLSARHEFVMSIDQLGKWYSKHTNDPSCPTCGASETARALRCTSRKCRRFFLEPVMIQDRPACPVCRNWLATLKQDASRRTEAPLCLKFGRVWSSVRHFLAVAMARRFSVVRKNKVPSEMAGVVKQIPPSLLVAETLNFSVAGMTKTSPCSPVK